MDQDSAFMSSLMNYLFMEFYIRIKTSVPHNHSLTQAEHGIKPFSTIVDQASDWFRSNLA